MKKLTIHEMAERYKIMAGIGGTVSCPHCKKLITLEIYTVAGIKEKY